MKLLYTPTSPYARKIRVLAHERGIALELQVTNPHADDPDLLAASPVGKVPVLVVDDGQVFQDSRVIAGYLESSVGRSTPPFAEQAREALAEAILDAAVTVVLERRRAEGERSPSAIDRQIARIRRIADAFEVQPPPAPQETLSLDQIGVATSLLYLDFRLPDVDWRAGRPRLADWVATSEGRAAFQATKPPTA